LTLRWVGERLAMGYSMRVTQVVSRVERRPSRRVLNFATACGDRSTRRRHEHGKVSLFQDPITFRIGAPG